MVGTTQGAGSGNLKIVGSIDTSMIEQGFKRVKSGFRGVAGHAKGLSSSLMRMTSAASGLLKVFGILGVIGPAALIGLASKAPAVAPAMAKMKVSFGKLSRSLGQALAPAFERVAGWLEKFAVWVGANQEKIGAVANKILDFAVAIGDKLWPVLKKVGKWALDHPALFAGIVAGLVLGPAIIKGISAISGLVSVLGGTVVSATVLTALGYIAAIGGAAYGLYKGAEYVRNKLDDYLGMGEDSQLQAVGAPGQMRLARAGQKARSIMSGGAMTPYEMEERAMALRSGEVTLDPDKSGGRMEAWDESKYGPAQQEDRKFFLLRWWDALWG